MERDITFMYGKIQLKVSFLPKLILGFNTIPVKIPASIFAELTKKNWYKIYMAIAKDLMYPNNVYFK